MPSFRASRPVDAFHSDAPVPDTEHDYRAIDPRDPHPMLALLPLVSLILMALASTAIWKIGMVVPIITGIAVAALVARLRGHSWSELEQAMSEGVGRAMPAVFILFIIGSA